jgi:hypothetical protein
MKFFIKSLFFGACIFMITEAQAQLKTPQPSTAVKLETTVGLTSVTLEYSRPSKKGRAVFGDLVPYDALWRTGANENTKITFGDKVTIGGTELKKGTYAIYTKPGKTSWEVYFYSDATNWGNPQVWDESKVAAKVIASPGSNSFVETFTINIGNVTNDAFDLEFAWDNLLVPVKVELTTKQKVTENIKKVLAGPSAGDYFNAARYYNDENTDLKQALEWVNKSIEMGSDLFYVNRLKSLIQAGLKDYKGAVETAKKSLAQAEAAKNADYVKMNQDSIEEWSKK